LVSRVLKGEKLARDQLEENSWLCERVETLLVEKAEATELLRRYLEKCERIGQMIALAKRIV